MSVLRVNKITDISGTGPVEFSSGLLLPSSFAISSMVINSPSGILTSSSLNTSSITLTGVCTATTYVGSGKLLTNLSGTTNSKAIALTLIT